jgi:hypothetical protein
MVHPPSEVNRMNLSVLRRPVLPALVLACLFVTVGHGQQPAPRPVTPAPAPANVDQPPPRDLRPLLTARQSEMRLVSLRYSLDRMALNGNFLGGARQAFGRGATPAPTPAEPLSPARIARLKRFDLDWQQALAALDPPALSPAARQELATLRSSVESNLRQLDADAAALADVAPLVPFSSAIVRVVEARIQLKDVDPEKAAGTLAEIAKSVAAVRASLEAGLGTNPPAGALRVSKAAAQRGPAAVDTLRAALAEWFTFYNGYDPLFTWWNGLPYKRANESLQAYAAFLKDKLAVADGAAAGPAALAGIQPAPSPAFASVPDLKALIALPQDEMTDIVQRFRGPAASGRGGRGDAPAPAAVQGAVPRDRAFFEGWLKALKTLDFDRLSRNAQADYLYIKKISELQVARTGVVLPENPPRKADTSGITGKARGRQGLIFDLQDELIPYTPEELIAIGEREFAFCEAEMKKASAALGMGDDWRRALEKMKDIHPPPGGQPAVIRDLMFEAVDYLRAHDLLTVPGVAAESLHMIMMTPERQLVNPFFTGGSEISVSYPTDTMEFDARLQSMRGNNTPFSHATAFHEMIPGHNLVFYSTARFRGYRPSLGGNSPFYGEGWPLYWELMMYEKGFHDTPEKKIGALFWRMHRCARIIFSLKFHMGEWSAQECVDFLVDRVGFERENAVGEVRRSFQGGYGPLYQAAYLLGGLQLRGLRREIVDSGQMGEKAFHDEVLRQGAMPITMLRIIFGTQKLTRDMAIDWKFYGRP